MGGTQKIKFAHAGGRVRRAGHAAAGAEYRRGDEPRTPASACRFFRPGGTSLLMLLGEMGIVLSVSRQTDMVWDHSPGPLCEGGKDVPTFVQPFFTLPPLQRREFCLSIKLYFLCEKGCRMAKPQNQKNHPLPPARAGGVRRDAGGAFRAAAGGPPLPGSRCGTMSTTQR